MLTFLTVIGVNAYLFLAFSDLTCHLKETGIGVFLWFVVALYCQIVRRPNVEVVTKMLLHQQVKILG